MTMSPGMQRKSVADATSVLDIVNAAGYTYYQNGELYYGNDILIDPYQFTLTEFNALTASDYAGIEVRITNVNSTAAGVGGVRFVGGSSWILTEAQIYYATYAAGIAAFPAATYPGLRMTFGDVGGGRVVHVSNGTRYMPDGGRFTFFQGVYGTVAAPTLTAAAGSTSFNFTLAASAPTIPANYLSTGFIVQVKARFIKHGTAAVVPTEINLGTAGTGTDAEIWGASIPNTDLNCTSCDCYAAVGSSTVFVTNSSSLQAGTGGAGQLTDKTTNFNITSAMIISVTGTKNTADSLDLLSLLVEIITTP